MLQHESSSSQLFHPYSHHPDDSHSSLNEFSAPHMSAFDDPSTVNSVLHRGTTSTHPQTRQYTYPHSMSHSSSNTNSFAQFLKEDDERFYKTFPDAAKAAEQQYQPYHQPQQLVVLGDAYRGFTGSTAFSYGFSASSSSFASTSTTAAPPINSPNVLDAPFPQSVYSTQLSTVSSPHDAHNYSALDASPILDEGYGQLSEPPPDVFHSGQEYNLEPYYSPPLVEPEGNHGIQFDAHPLPLSPTLSLHPHSPVLHLESQSPIIDYLHSPAQATDPLYPPVEGIHHLYSLSPETMTAGSPTTPTLPMPPSSLSPALVSPQEPMSSPDHLPEPPQALAQSPDDASSDPSSSKTAPPKPSIKRKRRRNLSDELSQSGSPRSFMSKIPLQKPTPPPAPKATKAPRTTSAASQGEKKSLALACFFCRGRKIACGPQDPSSPDRTCNQCHRRSLKCEYPTESRRGMRKRKSTIIDFREPDGANVANSSSSTNDD